jgi:acyl-CoA thioesterase FadM
MNADNNVSRTVLRPRFEGANIRTWIGFKHLMYLVEEAVLHWFRERGYGPQRLYREFGVGWEIVDCSAQFLSLLEIDDEVTAEATLVQPGYFSVGLRTRRDRECSTLLKAKVRVALVQETSSAEREALPESLTAMLVRDVAAASNGAERRDLSLKPGQDPESTLTEQNRQLFLWPWRARYVHCHYSDRVQHSAYVRALEEVVDRYLADRGISVGRMLKEYRWIPVVSRARVQALADVHMEETVHTTFAVEEIMKGLTYSARMECYVQRGGTMVHTATATILHGYAASTGPDAGRLQAMDQQTQAALQPERP